MDSFLVECLGLAAGCLTTCSLLPQMLHTWRTRSVADISLRMYLLLSSGVFLWMVYGTLIGSFSVIAANSMSFVFSVAMLLMKWRFGRSAPPG